MGGVALGLMGLALGLVLSLTARRFHVENCVIPGLALGLIGACLGLPAGALRASIQEERRRRGLPPSGLDAGALRGAAVCGGLGLGLSALQAGAHWMRRGWPSWAVGELIATVSGWTVVGVVVGLVLGALAGTWRDRAPSSPGAPTADGLSRLDLALAAIHASALCWFPLGLALQIGLQRVALRLAGAVLPFAMGRRQAVLSLAGGIWLATFLALLAPATLSPPRVRLSDRAKVLAAVSGLVLGLIGTPFGLTLLFG